MNINRKNYEVFLTDYIDGRLDPDQSNELLHFLTENPDLRKEFDDYENIKISPTKNVYIKKNLLKKDFCDIENINETNFDEFCVAKLEGDLGDDDEIRLNKYIKDNPEKSSEYELFSRLVFKPDNSIKYPGKKNIKRSLVFTPERKIYIYLTSAAAAIIFVMLVLIPGSEKDNASVPELAENQMPAQVIEIKDSQDKTESSGETKSDITENKPVQKIITPLLKERATDEPENNSYIREENILASLTPIETDLINISEYPAGMQSSFTRLKNQKEDLPVPENSRIQELRNRILPNNINLDINKINFWTAAEAGIKGFNYLTESELKLDKELNNEGEVTAFALNSETFSISSTRIK